MVVVVFEQRYVGGLRHVLSAHVYPYSSVDDALREHVKNRGLTVEREHFADVEGCEHGKLLERIEWMIYYSDIAESLDLVWASYALYSVATGTYSHAKAAVARELTKPITVNLVAVAVDTGPVIDYFTWVFETLKKQVISPQGVQE